MSTTYRIESLNDLFKVPMERREDMFREMQFAMSLCELARADHASLEAFEWTDDEVIEIRIDSPGSEDHGLSLKVTKEVQPQ